MTAVLAEPPPRTTRSGPAGRLFQEAPGSGALFDRAALARGPEREALLHEAVAVWLPMAHRIATKYRDRGEALEDLKQVAALGLMKAVTRFDPCRGIPFEAFAVPTIVGELKRHFRDHLWSVHVPRRVQQYRSQVRAARRELAEHSGEEPGPGEIAARAGLTEDEVRQGMEAAETFSALSLDHALSAGSTATLQDLLGAPDARLAHLVDREAVKPILRSLPVREKKILYLRFFAEMSQAEIGKEMGMSQMHVSRILTRICTRIRRQVLDSDSRQVLDSDRRSHCGAERRHVRRSS
ncbi:SigB/SigF/SigG family RNA polymerase sigma factor [Streptomyces sp. NPDC091272]|uniref:SigB/SigF/SigG family RNA polymerase sigma factor n=1 Tax=Streptomyces sp. NPDC091272 TaxID=3365981 RepID=UPI00381C1712